MTDYSVLVTGAAGYVGSTLAMRLARFGVRQPGDTRVRGLVRDSAAPAVQRLREAQVEVVVGDVTDRATMLAACEGIDAVVHAAFPARLHDVREANRVAVAGSRQLFEAASSVGTRRFVYLSSLAVYGGAAGVLDERIEPLPFGDRYADTKLAAERALRVAAAAQERTSLVVLRLGAVYGLGSPHWTNGPIRAARRDRLFVPPFGVPLPYLYANNLSEAVAAAIASDAIGVYNIFDGVRDYADFMRYYAKMTGSRLRTVPVPAMYAAALAGELDCRLTGRHAPLNLATLRAIRQAPPVAGQRASAAARDLGWRPRATLAQGMAVIRSYLDYVD